MKAHEACRGYDNKQMYDLDLEQYAKELHARATKPRKFRQVIADYKDQTWAVDLMDWASWDSDPKYATSGSKFIFCAIDLFTRYAFCRPMPDKTAASCWAALDDIMKETDRRPQESIWCDQGKEFESVFKKNCKSMGVSIYHTYGPHKAATVERFNQTLGRMLWHQFTAKQTRNWPLLLQDVVDVYNNRKHTAIGMSPDKASNLSKSAAAALWTRQYGRIVPNAKPKFEIGDTVRISRTRGYFEKSYVASWTGETFTIRDIKRGPVPMYYLRDYSGEDIMGGFYSEELQKVAQSLIDSDQFLIESVLSKRTKDGKKQMLVKWLGWPTKYNSWIDEADVTQNF